LVRIFLIQLRMGVVETDDDWLL